MNQESSQSTPLTRSQPNQQDHSHSRRMRSNSVRDQTGSDTNDQRSLASSTVKSDVNSDTSRFNRARGPIDEAVHSVLDPIDPTHSAISPELLNHLTSQITASVLQQLKVTQSSPPTAHVPSTATEQMNSFSSTGRSPPLDRDKVYTPPSPYRASEEAAQTTSPTSPRKQSHFPPSPGVRRPPSPPFSHATLSEDSDAKDGGKSRSRGERTSVDGEATILEKIWGTLFDEQDKPTVRLSQFLRGIAVHLIEDYEPKHSLVVSPQKMQTYYHETKLSSEIYPWQVVFDDRTSSISRLYREVEAQHHLVQDRLHERPDIPGLTPIGFEAWMTLVLKAHPEQEFERLAYTALHMPVSNPDDRKERFPKELSRRQFPKDGNDSMALRLQKLMFVHCGIRTPARNGSVSEKDTKPTNSSSALHETPLERFQTNQPEIPHTQTSTRQTVPSDMERNVLRTTVSETAANDQPHPGFPPPQIERERKPYIAQPGGGKNYDNLDSYVIQPGDSRPSQSGQPPGRLSRSDSLNGRPSEPKPRATQPISVHQKSSQVAPPTDIPPPTRARTGSTYHRDGTKRSDRNRSPSTSRGNGVLPKSDGDVSYGTGSYHATPATDYASNSYRSDNRHDHRGSISEQGQRDREPRQRHQSVSSSDGHRYYKDYPSEDEHHRPSNASYGSAEQYAGSQQYPPTSYRGRA